MRKFLAVLLTTLLLVNTAHGADKIRIRKFGGLNTRLNEYEIKNEESPDLSNFVLDKAGSLTERSLFKHYNTATIGTIPITHVYKFYKSTDVGFLICSAGTKLYNASAGTLSDISDTATTITSNSQWSFETFTDDASTINEIVFAANNDTLLSSWNGTGVFDEEAGYPANNCNILKKHKSRLFAAGTVEDPYRLYYSSLSDGDDWSTSGGTIDLPSYEKIMALEVLGDILYIFTRNTIYALYGSTPNEWSILPTRSTIGTHSYKSVVLGDKLIFFLHKSGVYAFDGDSPTRISDTIQPTINNISSTYISEAAGLFDNRGRYWLSYASLNSSINDTIVVYDTVIKQWYMLNGASIASFFKTEGGSDKGELYGGCSDNIGFLWQLQAESSEEQIVHSTDTQLATGVTFNTAILKSPKLQLEAETRVLKDANTILLCYFDGEDGDKLDTTDDDNARAITFEGTAELDGDTSKFGDSSLWMDGDSDYVTLADNDDWAFDNTWTMEWWGLGTGGYVFSSFEDGNNNFSVIFSNTNINIREDDGGATINDISASPSVSSTDWHHYEVVRNNNDIYMFVDGLSQTVTKDTGPAAHINHSGLLYIGQSGNSGGYINGRIDELRVHDTALHTSNFQPPTYSPSGVLNSDNLQINAAGQSELGVITWNEDLATNTDIQFQTRTGVTDDTTYWAWEGWVSASSVSLSTVTDDTAWDSNDSTNFTPLSTSGEARDIDYYEDEDEVNPNAIKFTISGDGGYNDYARTTVPAVDLSNYKFLGFWLKSPEVTNSVVLSIGEVSPTTVAYVTADTCVADTWEKHYMPLDPLTDTDIDATTFLEIKYLGDTAGDIILGEIWAYDFYDKGETITSTANDWIEYRAIMGTLDDTVSPELINLNEVIVSLSYSISGGTTEDSLISYWKSKPFDNGNEYNKFWQWVEFDVESSNPTTNHTVFMSYYLDDERVMGQLSKGIAVTGRRTKVRYYLPSGTYGKAFQFRIYDNDIDDDLIVNQATVSFVQEGGF